MLLIDENGVKLGIIPTAEGIRLAEERQLDLVEVAPQAAPPVCRILDYGKYRYQLQKKEKDARKKQKVQALKEMKMRPKIDEHDYDFKVKHAREFLGEHHKVKVTVVFRGRQLVYKDQGFELLQKFAADLAEVATVEREPLLEGKQVTLLLAPVRK